MFHQENIQHPAPFFRFRLFDPQTMRAGPATPCLGPLILQAFWYPMSPCLSFCPMLSLINQRIWHGFPAYRKFPLDILLGPYMNDFVTAHPKDRNNSFLFPKGCVCLRRLKKVGSSYEHPRSDRGNEGFLRFWGAGNGSHLQEWVNNGLYNNGWYI